MEGQAKKVVYELVTAFVVILLLVVLRPLFVGQVAQAAVPYSIVTTLANGSTSSTTVTPSATISYTQADTIYSIVIFLVALIALIVILLTIAGKI